MKKFLAVFALAGLVGISACSAEEDNTEVLETPEATTPPPVVDPTPIVVDVDSAPPMAGDTMAADTAAP